MLWLRLAAHSRMGEVPQQNYMAVFAIPGPEFLLKTLFAASESQQFDKNVFCIFNV